MAWRGYQIKRKYACPECKRVTAVTRTLNIRPHGIPGVTSRCPGSGIHVSDEDRYPGDKESEAS